MNVKANITIFCQDAGAGPGTKSSELSLVRRSTEAITVIDGLTISSCPVAPGATTSFDIDINVTGLEPNEIFDLHFFAGLSGGATGDNLTLTIHSANFSIDARVPNFVCGEFSACVAGSQSRICVDTTEVFPDRIEVVSCLVPQNFSEINLGFEDLNTTSITVLECKKNAFTCVSSPTSISPALQLPADWTIGFETVNDSGVITFHEAMAFLTTEAAIEGQRSLELNYRPPKLDVVTEAVPSSNPATCQNASSGFQGSLQTTDLNTKITSASFQFPGAFPALRWAAKKADSPRLQYDVNFFGANPLCSPKTLCYGDCNGTVSGTYSVNLNEVFENGNFKSVVFRFEGEATSLFSVVQADLNATNINETGFFQIVISTFVAGDDTSSIMNQFSVS